jgi:hypothetical protein
MGKKDEIESIDNEKLQEYEEAFNENELWKDPEDAISKKRETYKIVGGGGK